MIEAGVFDAGSVNISFNDLGDKYVITTSLATENMFGMIYPFEAKYEARGLKLKNGVKPVVYMTEAKSKNHIRTKKIFYDNQGVAYKRVASKDGKESQKEIKRMYETADVADLQTVFAEVFLNWKNSKNCGLEREVYDGKKHYKVIIEDRGQENRWFDFIKKNEIVNKCAVYIKNLEENNDNILWDVSADRPIDVWLGDNNGDGWPEIYEINIDKTMVGSIVVYPKN